MNSRAAPRTATWILTHALVLFAAACHLIAGDFETSEVGDSGPEGPGTLPGPLESCSEGEVRCRGAELQMCDPNGDPPWRTTRTCPSAVTCDAQAGLCQVCEPGQSRCAGWRLETCNAQGSDFDVAAQCTSSVYCDAAEGACLACLPGEGHCDGADLRVCSANGDRWIVTPCPSAELCNARSQSCRCCAPGELQCFGNTLSECVANCEWAAVTECATPELCTETVLHYPSSDTEGWGRECAPPACEPGTFQCSTMDGRQLLGCPPSRTGWEVFDSCDTAMLCDAEAGQCQTGCGPGITPGTYRCAGAELQQCSLDGTRFETVKTCASADHCNATRQDCVACVPNEYQCSGAALQRCTEGSTWETVEDCASALLCVAAEGRCAPALCEEGTFSCAGNVLRRCTPGGNDWETLEYCLTEALCDAESGHCSPPGCPAGGLVDCAGNVLRSCPSSLVAWEELQTCPEGWLCDAQNQQCAAECPDPPFQCQRGVPVECRLGDDGALSWAATGPPCLTSALCTASAFGAWCLPPICDPGEHRCTDDDPQVLQTCASGRDGWDNVSVCEGSICDPVGGQCDRCVANQFGCSGPLLQQCGPAGQAIEGRGLCRDSAHCYASPDGAQGYCLLCDPNESQCSGTNQIQECSSDRRFFSAPSTCDNGCQDNPGNTDYCAACPTAGEVQCVDQDRPGSTRTCPTDRRAWEPPAVCTAGFGCVNDGSNDYCAGTCAPNQATCVGATGTHTCNGTGEGFSPTVYECADDTHLRRCVGGTLSTTELVPCPTETPFCEAGTCVECLGNARECVANTSTRRECVNNRWQLENCAARNDGNTSCYQGDCAPCNSASAASCLDNDTRQSCTAGDWTTTDCTGTTPVCSSVLANCTACNANSAATCPDRTTRESCATNTGTWFGTSCGVRCLVVDGEGTCVACDPDTTVATCNQAGDGIRSCSATGTVTTTLCGGTTPVCTTVNGVARCVGCATGTCDGYCLGGDRCVACEPGTTGCRQSPPAAGQCDASGSWTYTDCTGNTPLCRAGDCVGCFDDSDCDPLTATGKCVDGTCRECVTSVDCPPTQSCIANSCGCIAPQVLCGTTCVDTASAPNHCGSCGNACVSTQTCVAGSCACPAPTLDLCGGACVDTRSDARHCGNCATECASPMGTCNAGECVACVSDGDCGAVVGQTCSEGRCVCPTSQIACGTLCTDPSTDNANCGSCGTACTALQQCASGSCVCNDSSLTVCDGACVNTDLNANHCGACGAQCTGSTPYCDTGTCVGCRSNTDCPLSTPYCRGAECVECLNSGDCAPSEQCSNGTCQ